MHETSLKLELRQLPFKDVIENCEARNRFEQEGGLEKRAARMIIKSKEESKNIKPPYQSYAFINTHSHILF